MRRANRLKKTEFIDVSFAVAQSENQGVATSCCCCCCCERNRHSDADVRIARVVVLQKRFVHPFQVRIFTACKVLGINGFQIGKVLYFAALVGGLGKRKQFGKERVLAALSVPLGTRLH
jgi:hypothetical protein